jgi:hypothetical protein
MKQSGFMIVKGDLGMTTKYSDARRDSFDWVDIDEADIYGTETSVDQIARMMRDPTFEGSRVVQVTRTITTVIS